VGVVGPCGAGKSTLVRALRARGIVAREIAQEHSGVPAMWQRITRPRYLVYLDVSREVAERRLGQRFPPDAWQEMAGRLAHARAHADLILETDTLTPDEVAERVMRFLKT
jgi:dephospho-CoA kinase